MQEEQVLKALKEKTVAVDLKEIPEVPEKMEPEVYQEMLVSVETKVFLDQREKSDSKVRTDDKESVVHGEQSEIKDQMETQESQDQVD